MLVNTWNKLFCLSNCVGEDLSLSVNKLTNDSVALLENLGFYEGETKNDTGFAKRIGLLCDGYVKNAFGATPRAHASTEGITRFVKTKMVGLLIEGELEVLGSKSSDPEH
jgi:phosphoglycerate kinase